MPAALTSDRFRADLAELLYQQPDEVDLDEHPAAAGLDSLRVITLVERWRAHGLDVTFIDLAEQPSFRHWWRLLDERQEERRRHDDA
ncbi:Isochorismatase [Streptomyces sp. ADI96-02]|uniref:phosphopantetheine-binding protein n=1 Tax=Streptomyces sp. ADI96-02 TaxID=1522760 RepID=UPI000F553CD0|nr:phosphopantetheine-binding protein [Streptomyces sp. ADI96-02]RPK67724.1 Isochorismatase [Streptomyces sp. ADI96-02]